MTMRPLKKDTNFNGDSPSDHIDNNFGTEDINRLDATYTNNSTIVDIPELEITTQIRSDDELLDAEQRSHSFRASGDVNHHEDRGSTEAPIIEYKVYRRRYFGLCQLVLLNIIVSWDVSNTLIISGPQLNVTRIKPTAKIKVVVIICC